MFVVVATQQPSVAVLAAVNLAFVIGHLDLRGNNHPRPGFVPLTRLSAAGAFISPSPSWRGSDSIRVLLLLLTLRSGRAILRYYPRLLSSWPKSSTDAPRLRSIAEAVASSFPLRLQPPGVKMSYDPPNIPLGRRCRFGGISPSPSLSLSRAARAAWIVSEDVSRVR